VAKKKKVENSSPSGKPNVEIPKFKVFDEIDHLLKRNSTSLKTIVMPTETSKSS
jgi:hypothetical protein